MTLGTYGGWPSANHGNQLDGMFFLESKILLRDVTDGTSNTMMASEGLSRGSGLEYGGPGQYWNGYWGGPVFSAAQNPNSPVADRIHTCLSTFAEEHLLSFQFFSRPCRFFCNCVSAVVSVLILCGCGGSGGPVTVTVKGSVSLDGKPVSSGQIIFNDVAGNEKAYAGVIKDGAFSFPSTVGQKKVSISSPQEIAGSSTIVGGTPGDPVSAENPAPQILESIPPKYNESTTLTADVTSGGENEFPFELTSN